MSYNWSIVTDKLYGIIKGSCKALTMYDAAGNETIDPDKATRFFATIESSNPKLDDFTILVALHDQGQNSYINIKTPELTDDVDFKKIHQIRNHIRTAVGQREGIKIVWQVFDQEIDPREEAVHNIKESKDVSKWFGTTKSSFQRIGEAKLIIRHNDIVNEDSPGARTRHIRALFVENKTGERFAYPHLHMSGARAFARHISNGGTNHDTIAEGIMNLSGDYISLRRAAHVMRQNQVVTEWIVTVRENMTDINRRLKSLHGPKGYSKAESILSTQAIILDETATSSMWQTLAEECACGQDEPFYGDLGVAAKYLGGANNKTTPISFSWNRKPNISGVPDDREVLERLHWQLSELADACADQHAAARLSEIAKMVSNNVQPTQEDIELVREAIASSMTQTEESILPEEAELESFLNEFAPDVIFAENDTYGVAQKERERDDEIAYNKEQRTKRWNFGEPLADDTAADSDLEEDSSIKYLPGIQGEVYDQIGDYYLLLDQVRYDKRTVKNEWHVYKHEGDKFKEIEWLDISPYARPKEAVELFHKKYTDAVSADNSMLERIKNLAGL